MHHVACIIHLGSGTLIITVIGMFSRACHWYPGNLQYPSKRKARETCQEIAFCPARSWASRGGREQRSCTRTDIGRTWQRHQRCHCRMDAPKSVTRGRAGSITRTHLTASPEVFAQSFGPPPQARSSASACLWGACLSCASPSNLVAILKHGC